MKLLKKNFGFIIIIFLLIPTIPLNPFYAHNQNTYFLKGFFKAGYLQDDWLANCKSTTTEFDYIVSMTLKIFPDSTEVVFTFFFAILLFVFLFYSYKIIEIHSSKKEALFTITFTALLFFSEIPLYFLTLLNLPSSIGYIPYNGLAGHSLISYFQPSVFGVLLFPAVFYLLKRKYSVSTGFVMICCLFHTSYILFGSFALLFIIFELIKNKDWSTLIEAMVIIIPFSIIIFFQTIEFTNAEAAISQEAKRILVEERSPHHHIIAHWIQNKTDWIRMIWLALGLWVFPLQLKKLFLLSAGGALTLTLVQYLTLNTALSLASPWRLTVIWVPLVSFFFVLKIIEKPFIVKKTRLYCSLAAGLFLFAVLIKWGPNKTVLHLCKNKTLSKWQGSLLIPPKGNWGENSENVRLNYFLPIFVDFKSHPYAPKEVLEWKKRIELANHFYKYPTVKNLTAIQNKQKIDGVIWPKDLGYLPEIDTLSRVNSEKFFIYNLSEKN